MRRSAQSPRPTYLHFHCVKYHWRKIVDGLKAFYVINELLEGRACGLISHAIYVTTVHAIPDEKYFADLARIVSSQLIIHLTQLSPRL